ncbi:hypothetical protein PQR05_29475 [Paraburkholderia sediminicola]|uniref:hypothetical protein n=1 Tax=Paraburkholderia sediminicola TaxID=458836 RepID=UPI0038BBCE2A
MARRIEEPTITEDNARVGDKSLRYEHPAYAQIAASRVSGHVNLYGSDFSHQHFVRIKVARSSIRRDLSNDWVSADLTPYIEVDLSEAQWASFVSSMNVGGGTQCTLRFLKGEGEIADLPAPASRRDQFKSEAIAACREAFAAIDELKAAIAETKLSQKQRDDLMKRADSVRGRLNGSLPFVLDQFGEHMEATVEKAKSEINAYYVATVHRAGLAALGAPQDSPLKLQGE